MKNLNLNHFIIAIKLRCMEIRLYFFLICRYCCIINNNLCVTDVNGTNETYVGI